MEADQAFDKPAMKLKSCRHVHAVGV